MPSVGRTEAFLEILFIGGLILVIVLASTRRGEQLLGAVYIGLGALVLLTGLSSGLGLLVVFGAALALAGTTELTVSTDPHLVDRYGPRVLAGVVAVTAYAAVSWLILGLIQLGAWIESF